MHEQLQSQADVAANEKRQSALIRDRFNKLDQNHVEMIKIKDELKADNEEIRNKLKVLQVSNLLKIDFLATHLI